MRINLKLKTIIIINSFFFSKIKTVITKMVIKNDFYNIERILIYNVENQLLKPFIVNYLDDTIELKG